MTFIVFGAVILDPLLDDVTWQIVLYALLSLTVVRMLPVALAMLGTGARRPTLAFLGWFGPRGLASIVFAAGTAASLSEGAAGASCSWAVGRRRRDRA